MIRLLLALLGRLALLFMLVLGAIRLQPHDDGGLRAGLYTPNCSPPCFMGITPGVTTWDETVNILHGSAWVGSVDAKANAPSLSWRWNGSQPAFLRPNEDNHLFFSDGVVNRIDLVTQLNAAAVILAFGTPKAWYFYTGSSADPLHLGIPLYFDERALYDDLEFHASTNLCPLTIHDQWSLLTEISMPPLPDHSRYLVSQRALLLLPEECR